MYILCNNTNYPPVFCLISGNQHLKRVAVCNCESHAETLIRANFWPGTPEKTMVGFHFKLMDLAVVLFLHNQVPLRDFSEMIMELVPKLQPILVNIYTLLSIYSRIFRGEAHPYKFSNPLPS